MLMQFVKSPFSSIIGRHVLRNVGVLSLNRYCSNNINNENIATAGTMNDVKSEIVKKLGIQEHWSVLPKSREYLTQYELKSPVELPPRSMQDSFTSAVIPLSTDLAIRDKYVTFF